jgi:P4 family phage/plasmid primase-like protien
MSLTPATHHEKLSKGVTWYAQHGWKILPCFGITDGGRCTCNDKHAEPKDVGKHPIIGEWNTRSTDNLETVSGWWTRNPDANIGVYCQGSGFIVIDIDPRSGGIDSFEKFEEMLGFELPPTVEAYTGVYNYLGKEVRGRHLYFKVEDGEQFVGNLKAAGLGGIDIKHNGYVMVAPSRHGSGVTYDWAENRAPWQIEMADAPEELLSAIRKKSSRGRGTSLGQGDWSWLGDLNSDGEKVDINKFLEEGIEEGSRAVDIYRLTCAIANKMGVDSEANKLAVETLMIRFNHEKVRPPLELEGQGGLLMHVRRAIDFVANNPVGDLIWPGAQDWARRNQIETITSAQQTSSAPKQSAQTQENDPSPETDRMHGSVGAMISDAAHSGVSISDAFSSGNVDLPKDPDALSAIEGGDPGRRSLSDIGNGRRMVDSFGSSIRYTAGIGWFIWDGSYWRPDAEDLGMHELAKRIPAIVAAEVMKYEDQDKKNEVLKWANQAKANSRLNSAIESANSDPRILVPVESWDGDEYLLGVDNGVINLRTGELLRGRPDLYITKRTDVAYTAGMRNVRWEQFIDFATGGDKELQDWIQRAVGYTLTGLNNQDVLFLVYGPPGSGKNTFVEAIVKALNTQQYAWPLDSNILADTGNATSSTDLYHWAELRGRRMVWVDELPESERMKENAVKKLTGSSEISARSPGEKPFTFKAQAKLWITTNHRPQINDDAMWRRIRPIPWSNVPQNPDPDLKAYLFDPEGGLPAILSWAVEGAIKYLNSSARDPLGWCTAVKEAADIYRKNEDRIGIFLEEHTRVVDDARTPIKSIYITYRYWCEDRGERPLAQTNFQRKLSDRGVKVEGTGSKAEVIGRILPPVAVPDYNASQSNPFAFGGIAAV